MELSEVGVPLGQLRQTPGQFPDEVEREVEPLEGLARLQVFDPLDRVHAQVEVLQTAQPRQVLDALDAVVLFEFRAKCEISIGRDDRDHCHILPEVGVSGGWDRPC